MPGRHPRQRRRRLDPRLLAAAAQPEARRGGAGAVPHRRAGRASCTAPRRRSCARPATSAPAPASSSSGRTARSSFLEVNTRLQVEHPVSEEVTGHRPRPRAVPHRRRRAARLRRPARRTATRSSSGSTARTPGATSSRTRARRPLARRRAGPASAWTPASSRATIVGGAFDSMLAKLVVTGRTRQQALERSRRALAEFVVEGMPTVLPFHRRRRRRPRLRPGDPRSRSRCTPDGSRPSSTTRSSLRRRTPAGDRSAEERERDRRRGRRQAPRGRRCRRASPPARPGAGRRAAQRAEAVGVPSGPAPSPATP